MTKLTINICAEDDRAAMRVLNRLHYLMDVRSGEDLDIHLNDAGYTTGHVDGSSTATVIRLTATGKPITKGVTR